MGDEANRDESQPAPEASAPPEQPPAEPAPEPAPSIGPPEASSSTSPEPEPAAAPTAAATPDEATTPAPAAAPASPWVAPGEPDRGCHGCAARIPATAVTCPACGVELPPPPRSPRRESRVSQQLRALGRLHRDIADDSDTLEGHPPLRDDEPLPEIVPRTPAAAGPPLPPVHPRRLTWLLLLALAFVCWQTGALDPGAGGVVLSEERLARAGALAARSWSEPWRLVMGTFVHQSVIMAVVTGFMVLIFGGELERRVGAGVVLFVVVAVGAGLNAARVLTEPAASLLLLGGGWPAGLALGGAAFALAVLAPSPGIRRPWGLAISIVIATAIILTVAHQGHLITPSLQATLFLSLGAGLVTGLVLSLARGAGQGAGCLLGGVAVAALVAAEVERSGRGRTLPAPPWEPSTPSVAAADLRTVTLDDLKVRVEVPAGWTEGTNPTCEVRCPACKQEVEVTATRGPSELTVPCPSCGEGRVKPKSRVYVDFSDSGLFGPRTLRLYSLPKGPFDAADTMATRFGAQMVREEGFLHDVVHVTDGPLGDAGWQQAAGWRSAWSLVLRGRVDRRSLISRMYFLVGERRTVQMVTIEPDEGGPPEATPAGALFDAIARSARELKE